jgi:hypothetical protein
MRCLIAKDTVPQQHTDRIHAGLGGTKMAGLHSKQKKASPPMNLL